MRNTHTHTHRGNAWPRPQHITAWKELVWLTNALSESQLACLNYYTWHFHFILFFKKKKKKAWTCKWSEIVLQPDALGAVLAHNFIRINHNLHDFSVIHWHLKLNFIDAWREPSLRGSASASGSARCRRCQSGDLRKILVGTWHSVI